MDTTMFKANPALVQLSCFKENGVLNISTKL